MTKRSTPRTKQSSRLPVITGGVAAGLASVALLILASLYLVPFGVIFCGGIWVDPPVITTGGEYFDKPDTIILSVRADRSVYVGPNVVRHSQLPEVLSEMRRKYPARALELRASKRVTLADLAPVLAAMQRAGYSQFWVFGERSAVLELAARTGT